MNTQAIATALKQVLAELQKADGAALQGGRGVKIEAEVEPAGDGGAMAEECEACATGTCGDPDHMDDASLEEMAGNY